MEYGVADPYVQHQDVEEKFEKYFGYFASCEGKFGTNYNPKIFKKIKPKSTKMQEKCRQNLKIDLWKPYLEIWNRDLKTLNPKP